MGRKKNKIFKKKLFIRFKKKSITVLKSIPVLAVNKMRGRCLNYIKFGVKYYYKFKIIPFIGKEGNWLSSNHTCFSKVDELSARLAKKLLNKKIDHWSHLLKCNSLKEAFAYSLLELSSAQYGRLLEKLISKKQAGWVNLKNGSPEGDIITKNKTTFELKVSMYDTKKNRFAFRNIKLHHTYMYVILIAYHINDVNYVSLGELYVFKLTKVQLLPFLASYCQYGVDVNWALAISTGNLELSEKGFTIAFNGPKWRLLMQYRITLEAFSML